MGASSQGRPDARRGGVSLRPSAARLLLVILAFAVYLNALDNPFVYDDHDTIVANPSLVDPSNIRFVLVHMPFRPVVNLSYAFDRAVWGFQPFGFHLTNVILHAAVSVLLFAFLRTALADAWLRRKQHGRLQESEDDDRVRSLQQWIAVAASAVFTVHPLMTEAVGYISGRSELLCALFFFGALILGHRAIVLARGGGRRSIVPVALAGACGALAVLSKEVGLGFPIVLLAYDWMVLPGPEEERRRRFRRVFLPALAVAILLAAFRLIAADAPVALTRNSYELNLLTQSIVIWRYAGLFFVPVGQSIMHGVHRAASPLDPVALVALAAWFGVVYLSVRIRRTVPLVAFGLIWCFAVLAPSSSIFALREGMAEHRAYLATAGLLMMLAGLSARVLYAWRPAGMRVPAALRGAVAALVLLLGALTIARNDVWGSTITIWREATVHAKGMWEPHYALGDELRKAGDCGAAIAEYEAVLKIQPAHRDATTNLGICLAETGRLAEADAAFRRVLAIDPSYARAYTNLATVAMLSGDTDAARENYLEAIAIDHRNVLARMQLAKLYENTFHDYDAAARVCGEARAIAPATPGVIECVERNRQLAEARHSGR
jgi:protein O-mannosyl-transferase